MRAPSTGSGGAQEGGSKQPQQQRVIRSLIDESARAELSIDGLFVDLGTPDQHKYTLGGQRTGWLPPARERGGATSLARASRAARLVFSDPQGGVRTVILRARSRLAGQVVRLFVDERPVGRRELGAKWAALALGLERPLDPGRHVIVLRFRLPGPGNRDADADADTEAASADVDWVWLARRELSRGEVAPTRRARVATRSFGSPRVCLIADPPRQLSYHYPIDPHARLELGYGADGPAEFELWVNADGEPPRRVFRREVQSGPWREMTVDLSRWAGRLVRLDLVSRGRARRAGWSPVSISSLVPVARAPVVSERTRAQNLIYILIDTARQDAYPSFNSKTRVRAHAMTRFAEQGVVFANAYNHDNWTKPSVATALTGLYSSSHQMGPVDTALPARIKLLSEHLRSQGFETAALTANIFVSERFGFRRGWDLFRNYPEEKRPGDAEHLYADALTWLRRRGDDGRRFFLWIHAMDPHVPYEVPRRLRTLYFPGVYRGPLGESVTHEETRRFLDGRLSLSSVDRRYLRALYDGEITYHDEQFGRFIEQLRTMDLLDETLVVVSNDHGEEMFDHGKVGHWHTLFEELIRNPLVMRYPRLLPAGRRIQTLVGLVDLAPTVLEVLGVSPMPRVEGSSLLAVAHHARPPWGHYAIAEHLRFFRAVRVGSFKLIQRHRVSRLYDLSRDPGETEDLLDSHPIARRACEVYLGEAQGVPVKHLRLTGGAGERFAPVKARLDTQTRRQLEALGYVR